MSESIEFYASIAAATVFVAAVTFIALYLETNFGGC